MYYVELVYLDQYGKEMTTETLELYAESENEADIKAYELYLNSTADDYKLKQQ